MIPTMDDRSHRQSRAILLADLASTRADLIEIYASTLGRLSAARSAQWIAATGGFSADTRFDLGVGGTPISPAQLAASIKQIESEATRVRELLAQVDAGLAEVSPAARGGGALSGPVG
ncbi:hypothetical protein SBBP2_2340006 [Burkholderiales bacterium]|nr:hypothetical protein SBBP2_2340006 [Burkholderiales bacterium]